LAPATSFNSTAAPRNQTGERAVILRNRMGGHKRLMKDYFVEFPVYNNWMFERRFRMSRQLFD
jgi:hypothetical protein